MVRKRALAMGFEVNAAVAGNPDTALLAAKGMAGTTVVPQGKARIRTQMSAAHSREDLTFAVEAFAKVKSDMKLD